MTTARSEPSGTKNTLRVLGATGDLTARLLLPGLGALVAGGGGEQLLLVGSAKAGLDEDRWRQLVADSFAAADAKGAQVDAVVRGARYLEADVTVEDDLRRLLDACQGHVAIFFALPPAVTVQACQALAGIQLPEHTRLVLEKPFGTDAASASALNDLLVQLVPEDQVYRVNLLGGSCLLLTRTALTLSPAEGRELAPSIRELAVAVGDLAAAPGDRATR